MSNGVNMPPTFCFSLMGRTRSLDSALGSREKTKFKQVCVEMWNLKVCPYLDICSVCPYCLTFLAGAGAPKQDPVLARN